MKTTNLKGKLQQQRDAIASGTQRIERSRPEYYSRSKYNVIRPAFETQIKPIIAEKEVVGSMGQEPGTTTDSTTTFPKPHSTHQICAICVSNLSCDRVPPIFETQIKQIIAEKEVVGSMG